MRELSVNEMEQVNVGGIAPLGEVVGGSLQGSELGFLGG